jgi:NAD(P)H-hydrate epimerase
MPPLLTAAQMRAVDRAAIDGQGIPSVVLMESAGRGVVEALLRVRPRVRGVAVAVIAGAGQNGGDGLVIARLLANQGAQVKVALTAPRDRIKGDAQVFLSVAARTAGVTLDEGGAGDEDEARWRDRLAGNEILVDAVFGTGLRADVTGVPAAAIRAMNALPALRVAVDVPSGLDADSGVIRGVAVRADLTATMAAGKVGHWVREDAPVGRVEVVDIGFHLATHLPAAAALGPLCHLLDAAEVAPLLPRPPAGGHKGTRGHALLVAGSAGKTGAAMLSGTAALRAGAGLVTAASTAAGQAALDAKVLEVMTAVYTAGDDADAGSWDRLTALATRMKAAALGPGIPTGEGMRALVRRLAGELTLPLVIDADGLSLLATDVAAALKGAAAPRVLTPHPGEMARLTGLSTAQIAGDRLGVARRLAAECGVVVVLKGARTVVADPSGEAFINPTADPALGTAGSGDVLTGVILGLLAQGLSARDAAICGVFIHGAAAAEAKRAVASRFIVAGDLPLAVARELERLLERSIGA